jgi:hypothetical protein
MKRFAIVAGLALSMSVGAFGTVYGATVLPYQQAAFDAAQKRG